MTRSAPQARTKEEGPDTARTTALSAAVRSLRHLPQSPRFLCQVLHRMLPLLLLLWPRRRDVPPDRALQPVWSQTRPTTWGHTPGFRRFDKAVSTCYIVSLAEQGSAAKLREQLRPTPDGVHTLRPGASILGVSIGRCVGWVWPCLRTEECASGRFAGKTV